MNAYYDTAAKLGVEIAYETEVRELKMTDGQFASAVASQNGASKEYAAKTLVVASGGFEANIPWLKEYWGDAADNFIIRGTPHNQGRHAERVAQARRQAGGRSARLPRRRARRARAEVRRRHRHAAGQRAVWHRRQQRRETILRRGRGFLAEALRDLGQAHRGATGADRLFRSSIQKRCRTSCRRYFRRSKQRRSPSLPRRWRSIRTRFRRVVDEFNRSVRRQ